jgi:acetyl-CoA acetyltransferase
MTSSVVVAGVGMVPFAKPGASATYDEMGATASRMALADAGIGYESVQQAYAGYVYGDSTAGQKAIYPLGLTGIPIVNVNNNCSTGSTALFLGRQAVASGAADCVLVLGFEQMRPGALGSIFADRPSPFEDFDKVTDRLVEAKEIPLALRYFGGAGLSHMKKYGTKLETFARVRAKASRHAKNNPLAIFRREVTAEEVMSDKVVWPGVMTRLMAAAAFRRGFEKTRRNRRPISLVDCCPKASSARRYRPCSKPELTRQPRASSKARRSKAPGARNAAQPRLGGACVGSRLRAGLSGRSLNNWAALRPSTPPLNRAACYFFNALGAIHLSHTEA